MNSIRVSYLFSQAKKVHVNNWYQIIGYKGLTSLCEWFRLTHESQALQPFLQVARFPARVFDVVLDVLLKAKLRESRDDANVSGQQKNYAAITLTDSSQRSRLISAFSFFLSRRPSFTQDSNSCAA